MSECWGDLEVSRSKAAAASIFLVANCAQDFVLSSQIPSAEYLSSIQFPYLGALSSGPWNISPWCRSTSSGTRSSKVA